MFRIKLSNEFMQDFDCALIAASLFGVGVPWGQVGVDLGWFPLHFCGEPLLFAIFVALVLCPIAWLAFLLRAVLWLAVEDDEKRARQQRLFLLDLAVQIVSVVMFAALFFQ